MTTKFEGVQAAANLQDNPALVTPTARGVQRYHICTREYLAEVKPTSHLSRSIKRFALLKIVSHASYLFVCMCLLNFNGINRFLNIIHHYFYCDKRYIYGCTIFSIPFCFCKHYNSHLPWVLRLFNYEDLFLIRLTEPCVVAEWPILWSPLHKRARSFLPYQRERFRY